MPPEEFQSLRAGAVRTIFSAIGFRLRFPPFANAAEDCGTNGTLTAVGMRTTATPSGKISQPMYRRLLLRTPSRRTNPQWARENSRPSWESIRVGQDLCICMKMDVLSDRGSTAESMKSMPENPSPCAGTAGLPSSFCGMPLKRTIAAFTSYSLFGLNIDFEWGRQCNQYYMAKAVGWR